MSENEKAATTSVTVRFPTEMLAEFDARLAQQEFPTTRTAVITSLVRRWLRGEREKDAEKVSGDR